MRILPARSCLSFRGRYPAHPDRMLFIDARIIFSQIDRAHREFNEAQIQNIAIIRKLHKDNRRAFIRLLNRYFEKGMALLQENKQRVEPVSEQLLEVLENGKGKLVVDELVSQWKGLKTLQGSYKKYLGKADGQLETDVEIKKRNQAQHTLREAFDPFFDSLHLGLKQLDKSVRRQEKAKAEIAKANGKRMTTDRETKKLKAALEQLHKEVKNAKSYYKHIYWLQERFPKAEYEDVTGLCKLATQEEVKEQDYSLNPGRYVGVVIEEDGKTEEEFIAELADMNDSFISAGEEAKWPIVNLASEVKFLSGGTPKKQASPASHLRQTLG